MTNDSQSTVVVRPQRRHRKVVWFVYMLFLAGLLFGAYRACLWLIFDVSPVSSTNSIDPHQFYYEELWQRNIVDFDRQPDTLEVLILGGSVAEQTAAALNSELSATTDLHVRVHNAARAAHTTRDSLQKLEFLMAAGRRFDLVLVYHGINDVRMNNVREDLFRADYTHCLWYESFRRRLRNPEVGLQDLAEFGSRQLIELGQPSPELTGYGEVIKTREPFYNNLLEVSRICRQHQIPVGLMSFAAFFTDDYSLRPFEEIDYASSEDGGAPAYQLGTELWGIPEHVQRTVAAHNEMIRQLVDEGKADLFTDQAESLTQIELFTDVCHLSRKGIRKFAENVRLSLEESELAQRLQLRRSPIGVTEDSRDVNNAGISLHEE